MHRNGHGTITLALDSRQDENITHYDVKFQSDSDYELWKKGNVSWVKTMHATPTNDAFRHLHFIEILRELKDCVVAPLTLTSNINTPCNS